MGGSVGWRSPANLALVKYWGKRGNQLPQNPSFSLTLKNCYTETWVHYIASESFKLKFLYDGREEPLFENKIRHYLEKLFSFFPFLGELSLTVESRNTFPHSAGIASSASSMSALALCLCSIEEKLQGKKHFAEEFFKRASFVARLGSGSACRSLYPSWALWGKTPVFPSSSDEYGVSYNHELVSSLFHDLQDTVLLVDSGPKEVSSRLGHSLMEDHPYAQSRYKRANENLNHLLQILKGDDFLPFAELVESEALDLHSLMMSSQTPFLLMKPETLFFMDEIRKFRRETKTPVAFTLDAGPNVHVLYPSYVREKVLSWIQQNLTSQLIVDQQGMGPEQIFLKEDQREIHGE